jgi:hypothetical protein
MPTTTTISTLTHEKTLGPLSAAQRTDIMNHATVLAPAARQLFRRLLILGQERGLESESIARAAAQARAHDEGVR